MLALGIVLNTVGLALFCWLIFALAVYVVPFFVAVSIGMLTFHSGAGVIGVLLVGIFAGASTLVMGQTAFAMTRSTILRAAIGAVFAVPAAIAGYHVVLAMSLIGLPSLAWREVFGCIGAVSVGATAWMRLTHFAEPHRWYLVGRLGVGFRRLSRPPPAADSLDHLGCRTGSRRSAH
jgi:hypothetical protein